MIRSLAFAAALAVAAPAIAAPPQSTPAGARACIDPGSIASKHAESDDVLVFHMLGGAAYRNRLITHCPGLTRINDDFWSLETEPTSGSQLCRGDRIRPFDPAQARTVGIRSFPACGLGSFEPAPDLARRKTRR